MNNIQGMSEKSRQHLANHVRSCQLDIPKKRWERNLHSSHRSDLRRRKLIRTCSGHGPGVAFCENCDEPVIFIETS